MSVVTRFPPSPTGFMHIGNARTALYNWLFARNQGGKFLVRIEDTDRARHSEEAVLAIMNGLKWLGLEWDGDVVSQFEQRDRHVDVANHLIEKSEAYYCYCSKEELEQMRADAKAKGLPVTYDRRWRDRDPSEAPAGVQPVVRIKAPLEGETVIRDEVQGEIRVQNRNLDDFIILRSDGTPTYMLSVVVDDHDMGVTHVIRGDDHLNNTFRQKVIFEAMSWDVPIYAHLPMILAQDSSKLSKRHGAVSLEDFKEGGYLPEAVLNYLLRLGWGHGNDEIISREQAIEWFSLKNVVKSAAKFDYAKLDSLNTHYMTHANDDYLISLITPFLHERHDVFIEKDDLAQKRLRAGMPELKARAKNLLQLADEAAFYAKKVPLGFDEKALKLLDQEGLTTLQALNERLATVTPFTAETVEKACRATAEEIHGGKLGKVAMPLRAALTGTSVSPSIFHAAEILGREETLERLNAALTADHGPASLKTA